MAHHAFTARPPVGTAFVTGGDAISSNSRRDRALAEARRTYGVGPDEGMIGPNAVTQMLAVLAEEPVADAVPHFLARAGLQAAPPLSGMMPETLAARLHQALRADWPRRAPHVAAEAGVRTAAYILANRIPKPAQALLRVLPAVLAGPVLSKAIAANAWTFAGSGQFRVAGRWPAVFEIADNPVVRGERADHPICHWHAAVFETLFRTLVHPGIRCVETECCAMGAPACRFSLRRG